MKTQFQRSETRRGLQVIPHEHFSKQTKKYKLIKKDLLFSTFFSNENTNFRVLLVRLENASWNKKENE